MIAITGSTGTVGTALRKELSRHDVPFVSLYRTKAQLNAAAAFGETVMRFDFQQPTGWASVLRGITTLFLLGTGVDGQADSEIALATEAARVGVARIVKLSVIGTNDRAFKLGVMHKSVEDVINELGVTRVFIRPNGFMQNLENFMGASIAAGGIYHCNGDAKISFVDVRDIAAVARVALVTDSLDNRAITLTGSRALDHAEVASILEEELGWPVNCVNVHDEIERAAIVESGITPLYADYLINLAQFFRRNGGSMTTDTIQSITGKTPRSIEQYARDYRTRFVSLRAGLLAQTA